METIAHQGRRTAYERVDRDADGPTLLFVHGSGGSREVWKAQHRLADRFPVATMDLGGHGDSEDVEADPGFTALSAYADDVVAVVEAVDADVLVGNSLGGAVVQHVLLERSPAVRAAVLTGTGARLGVLEDLLAWLEDDFERALEFLHGTDRLFHDPDPAIREASIETMRACGREVTARDFETCHGFDVRNRLGEIDVPVLALCGEYDQLTPTWFHEYLAEGVRHGAFYEIEGAAHLAMLEQPEPFNRAVTAFVDGLPESE